MNAVYAPKRFLCQRDPTLAAIIRSDRGNWPDRPSESPIWGLLRIIIAQQVTTSIACRNAERLKATYPGLAVGHYVIPDVAILRYFGLPERRARCCAEIVEKANRILADVQGGLSWQQALSGIRGIGPWTVAVFRIMVLREPDVLPSGDVGLQRAIAKVHGPGANVETLSQRWQPYRSGACWYLWRT